jgi:DNA-directed RNA polymerase specialized sigma24 family protein
VETDAVLMQWSVSGRPDAFVEVVRRHEVAVHAFLARRAGRETADDLLAEVWLRAFANAATYDASYADARPWLYGIARNVLRAHWRSGTRGLAACRLGAAEPCRGGRGARRPAGNSAQPSAPCQDLVAAGTSTAADANSEGRQMAEEIADAEHPDPLSLLGEVEPPAAAVLENAREVLWSAVASEMLELDRVEDAVREPRPSKRPLKRPSRHRRTDREP